MTTREQREQHRVLVQHAPALPDKCPTPTRNEAQNLTPPSAAQAGADASRSNRRDWEYFDKRLTELRVNDVANIIERGRVLAEMNDELETGSYEATAKRHFDLSYARKLRIIAAHPVLSNRSHANALPPHPETLYQLSRLPTEVLRAKLADGSINPRLERREVAGWRQSDSGKVEVGGRTVEPKLTLAEKLKAANTRIATLEARLKSAGGSLFDLKLDPAEEIGKLLADNMSEFRFDTAVKAAKARFKAKRQIPAG